MLDNQSQVGGDKHRDAFDWIMILVLFCIPVAIFGDVFVRNWSDTRISREIWDRIKLQSDKQFAQTHPVRFRKPRFDVFKWDLNAEPFSGKNDVPELKPGLPIIVATESTSVGNRYVTIEHSYCAAFWWTDAQLPMASVIAKHSSRTGTFGTRPDQLFGRGKADVWPGEEIRCISETVVPNDVESVKPILYVIGNINYDDLGNHVMINFVGKYNPKTVSFELVKYEPSYDNEGLWNN